MPKNATPTQLATGYTEKIAPAGPGFAQDVGSLLERWNAFAPVAFPVEAKRYAAECLAISRYKLNTHAVPLKGGGLPVGAVGSVSFAALNYDRY